MREIQLPKHWYPAPFLVSLGLLPGLRGAAQEAYAQGITFSRGATPYLTASPTGNLEPRERYWKPKFRELNLPHSCILSHILFLNVL